MAWKIKFEADAIKDLARLDKDPARRIMAYLTTRIATLEDPRSAGEALKGSMAGLWRYRVGDYRVICDIQDSALVVLVIRVGHRKDVYR